MGIDRFPKGSEVDLPAVYAQLAKLPRGLVTAVTVTSASALALGLSTGENPIMVTAAVKTEANRRYRLRGYVHQGGGTQNWMTTRWRQGNGIGGTLLAETRHARNSTGPYLPAWCEAIDTPGDNPAMQWSFTIFMNVGAGDAYQPAFYSIEDLGAP